MATTAQPTPSNVSRRAMCLAERASCGLDALPLDALPPIGPGFLVEDRPLPTVLAGLLEETVVPDLARRQIALIVMYIARGATPEEIVHDWSPGMWRLFEEDELERAEALAHADLIACVLAGAA